LGNWGQIENQTPTFGRHPDGVIIMEKSCNAIRGRKRIINVSVSMDTHRHTHTQTQKLTIRDLLEEWSGDQ